MEAQARAELEDARRRRAIRGTPAQWIGYNGTFVATRTRMRLALVAVGYADGLDRKLSNRFSLLVRRQRAPVVGRIRLWIRAVIDVTEIPDVASSLATKS